MKLACCVCVIAAAIMCVAAEQMVSVRFLESDVHDVARYYAALTGKSVVVDPSVKGRISVMTPSPVPRDEAVRFIEKCLEMRNLVFVPRDDYLLLINK